MTAVVKSGDEAAIVAWRSAGSNNSPGIPVRCSTIASSGGSNEMRGDLRAGEAIDDAWYTGADGGKVLEKVRDDPDMRGAVRGEVRDI